MTDIEIHMVEHLDCNGFNVKKPFFSKGIHYFDVFFKNKMFLLQTNMLKVKSKGRYIQFNVVDENFKNKFSNVMNHLYGILQKNKEYKALIHNKRNVCSINNNVITFSNLEEEIDVYDIDYMLKGGKEVLSLHDNVRLILYLKNIWVNDTAYGVNLKIIQLQLLEPYNVKRCLFKNKSIPIPPPPPPPPPPPRQIPSASASRLNISTLHTTYNNYFFNKPRVKTETIRPTLSEIITSKEKLKKTMTSLQ